MTTNIHTAARFWIESMVDDAGFTVEGWHNSAQRWNGFACPAFEFDAAARIARWLDDGRTVYRETPTMRYDDERDAFIEWYDGEDVAVYNAFECVCDDGQTRRLYGIGAYYWTWWLDTDEA